MVQFDSELLCDGCIFSGTKPKMSPLVCGNMLPQNNISPYFANPYFPPRLFTLFLWPVVIVIGIYQSSTKSLIFITKGVHRTFVFQDLHYVTR